MIKRIYLEITDSCNLNCPFCTNSKGSSFMSFEDIADSIDQIKEVCDYIYLHVLGEPLLHPDFEKILDLLDEKNIKLQLVTNGTLLKNYPSITSHSCLRKLSVSLHSINNIDVDDSYFRYIDKLIEQETDAVTELRFYGSELDNKLSSYLRQLENRYNFTGTSKNRSYRLKNGVYVYFEDFFRWPDINDAEISDTGKCLGASSMLAILHNGDVTICCLDPKGHNRIGNIKEKSLSDIISSDLYKNTVSNFRNGRLSFELCRKCSYRLRFDDNSN